eukprot:Clim_evm24s233 gene=Clim_evmTU24s233
MAPLAAAANATGQFYLINGSGIPAGTLHTTSIPGFFQQQTYVYPNDTDNPVEAIIVATDETQTPCTFENKALIINLEGDQGSLNLYTQASYQNWDDTCNLSIVDAVPVNGSATNVFASDEYVTVWASGLTSPNGAYTVLASCNKTDYLSSRSCGGVKMHEQEGGLGVPYTGHLVAFNNLATAPGSWSVSQNVADLFVHSGKSWPDSESQTSDLGIIAQSNNCNGTGEVLIDFDMGQGTATIEFEYTWTKGSGAHWYCYPKFQGAGYLVGEDETSPFTLNNGTTNVLAVTWPIENDQGVPTVHISACTQAEWDKDSCPNAPKAKVLGGINI